MKEESPKITTFESGLKNKTAELEETISPEKREQLKKLLDRAMRINSFEWKQQVNFENLFKSHIQGSHSKYAHEKIHKIHIRKIWIEMRAAGRPFQTFLEEHIRSLLAGEQDDGLYRCLVLYSSLQYTDVTAFLGEALNHKTVWDDSDRSNFIHILNFLAGRGDQQSIPYFTKLLGTLVAHGQKHAYHQQMLADTVSRLRVIAGNRAEEILMNLATVDSNFKIWFEKEKPKLFYEQDPLRGAYWYKPYNPEPFNAELEEKRLKQMQEEVEKPTTYSVDDDGPAKHGLKKSSHHHFFHESGDIQNQASHWERDKAVNFYNRFTGTEKQYSLELNDKNYLSTLLFLATHQEELSAQDYFQFLGSRTRKEWIADQSLKRPKRSRVAPVIFGSGKDVQHTVPLTYESAYRAASLAFARACYAIMVENRTEQAERTIRIAKDHLEAQAKTSTDKDMTNFLMNLAEQLDRAHREIPSANVKDFSLPKSADAFLMYHAGFQKSREIPEYRTLLTEKIKA